MRPTDRQRERGGIAAEEMEGRAEQGVGLGGKHKWPHESISGFTLSIPLRPHDTWVAVEKSARERSGDGKAHISGSNERPFVKKKKWNLRVGQRLFQTGGRS